MIMFKTIAHNQRANAILDRDIWHSCADCEHLYDYVQDKCSRSARECQIGCADLAFAR